MLSSFAITIHIRIHHHFSTFFCVLAAGPPAVVNGSFSFKFSHPALKPLITLYGTVHFGAAAAVKQSKKQNHRYYAVDFISLWFTQQW